MNKKAEIGSKKWKDLRLQVLARDGYVCYVCGGEADQVDHLFPRAKGGDTFDQFNCAAICRKCNLVKGSRFFIKTATPPVFPYSIGFLLLVYPTVYPYSTVQAYRSGFTLDANDSH